VALVPEPENPYDPGALRVEVDLAAALAGADPEAQQSLADALQPFGLEIEDLAAAPVHIGYVPRSGGKPLLKAQEAAAGWGLELAGNVEVSEALGQAPNAATTLLIGPDGRALVVIAFAGGGS